MLVWATERLRGFFTAMFTFHGISPSQQSVETSKTGQTLSPAGRPSDSGGRRDVSEQTTRRQSKCMYLDEQNPRLRLTKAAGLPTIWGPPRFTLWDLGMEVLSLLAPPLGARLSRATSHVFPCLFFFSFLPVRWLGEGLCREHDFTFLSGRSFCGASSTPKTWGTERDMSGTMMVLCYTRRSPFRGAHKQIHHDRASPHMQKASTPSSYG